MARLDLILITSDTDPPIGGAEVQGTFKTFRQAIDCSGVAVRAVATQAQDGMGYLTGEFQAEASAANRSALALVSVGWLHGGRTRRGCACQASKAKGLLLTSSA